MTTIKKLQYEINHNFDEKNARHFVNGFVSVLHCHHYSTLYAQLADDAELLDGKALLVSSTQDVFYSVLKKYFQDNGISCLKQRIIVTEQYYSACGLGKLTVVSAGADSGDVILTRSHVDEGWIKKWGKREKPVNFLTQGFIAAAFSSFFDLPSGSFEVVENQSIVAGAEKSKFTVIRK
ncbi:hypothetical protein KKF34_01885 [Myxococcota bacterium]|nr:hypothetical protein [Myxococcota bacterium]MBU1382758.1 hypothetical protein [Myxococcota bacterium]MBU1495610.1 hypothetical protein [Myxococcota bacterium]